jgi:hypothetical protein
VPEISRFFGIVIYMYFREHEPPHFHAVYGDNEALISIDTSALLSGWLPPRAMGLVIEWASLHRDELKNNWEKIRHHDRPEKIQPLS